MSVLPFWKLMELLIDTRTLVTCVVVTVFYGVSTLRVVLGESLVLEQ